MKDAHRGPPTLLSKHQSVPMRMFHWAEQVLLAGKALLLNSLDEVSLEESDTRSQMETTGFKSKSTIATRWRDGRVNGCVAPSLPP